MVCGHGAVHAGAKASGGLHPAQEGRGHERRPEGRGRDGRDAGPRGGLLHQVRGLQFSQDGAQVRRPFCQHRHANGSSSSPASRKHAAYSQLLLQDEEGV